MFLFWQGPLIQAAFTNGYHWVDTYALYTWTILCCFKLKKKMKRKSKTNKQINKRTNIKVSLNIYNNNNTKIININNKKIMIIITIMRIKWRGPFIHIENLSAGAVYPNDKNRQMYNFISDERWSIKKLNVGKHKKSPPQTQKHTHTYTHLHMAQWMNTNRQNSLYIHI